MTLDLNWSRYTTNELVRGFHDRLHARLAGQPGVIATASSLTFPLDGHRRINVGFVIEGQPRDPQVTLTARRSPERDARSTSTPSESPW